MPKKGVRGNKRKPSVFKYFLVILLFVVLFSCVYFGLSNKQQNYQTVFPPMKSIDTIPSPSVHLSPTVSSKLKTYRSEKLGISFDYFSAGNQQIKVYEEGSRVYLFVYQPPYKGKSVEVFSKDPADS